MRSELFSPFGGIQIIEVEPGTEITDPATGEKDTVTDDRSVGLRHRIYVTPKNYRALQAAVPAGREALNGARDE